MVVEPIISKRKTWKVLLYRPKTSLQTKIILDSRRVAKLSSTSEEHLFTSHWEHSPPSKLSPQLTLSQPSSRRNKESLLSQEVNLVSQSEVASSTLQEMDMDTKLTLPHKCIDFDE